MRTIKQNLYYFYLSFFCKNQFFILFLFLISPAHNLFAQNYNGFNLNADNNRNADTTKHVQYRRTIEPNENQQSYEQKYFGKELNELKRSLFPLERTGIWTELNPKVPRVDYIGVHFVNKDTGWACGDLGALIKTTNGGQDWTVSQTNTTTPILKVKSFDGLIVLASGYGGLILRSVDGGESFTQITSGVNGDLWGLQMINDTLGWACGTLNSLIKTTNGGQTWERIYTPGYVGNYWWLDFLTNNIGYVACDNGLILKTLNGGNNWQQKQAGNNDPIFSINIIDSLHIAAVGANGKTIYSSNAGENWIENPSFTGWDLNCVYFVNKDTGYTVGENLNLRRTSNRGVNWESENLNVGEWEIQLQNEENFGVAVGNALKLCKTENGFENWILLIINENFSDVYFLTPDVGFALGNSLYKTQDGGLTFDKQINGPGGNCIVFVDSLVGYIGSSRCYIYKTMDSGNSWYRTNRNGLNDTIGTTNKIFFISDNIGWAITSRGGILKTTDSGENWFTQLNAAISVNFFSIYFIDSLVGWTANTGARPFKTTDGGNNWIQQTNLDIWESRDIYFRGSLNGFIINDILELLRTTNSGVDWFVQLNTQYVIRNLGWLSPLHGFIMGDGVYETVDSGNTWEEILELRNIGLRKFQSPKNYIGYSSGYLGLIYKYLDTTIVPVELVSFNGIIQNNKISLTWHTASEINSLGFQVEKSIDKLNWFNIGFVEGNGTTVELSYYSFIDNEITSDIQFYRLKQIDYNGSFEYSKIIEVNSEITNPTFQLFQNFPNPFNASTIINYKVPVISLINISLYDIKGEKILELVNEEKEKGLYKTELENVKLPSGIYFVRMITSTGYSSVIKITQIK